MIKEATAIEQALVESGKRMRKVRETAEALREAGTIPESEPRPQTVSLEQAPSPSGRQR